MKLVLYIIALVSIIGAAAFSSKNIGAHKEQLSATKDEEKKVIAKKVDVEDRELELKAEEDLRAEQEDLKNQNIATKELKENEERTQKRLSSGFDEELKELLTEKERINQVIIGIERELEGINVPLEEIEGFVTALENEKQDLENTNTALTQEVAIFKGSVEGNKSVIEDFKNAQIKRRNNLSANKVSSLITAVDNEWGFVVVKPHVGSLIKPESKLVVIRGNKHIGRLTINAIEGGRILANIDYSSLVPGMRIRPGDRVILSQPVTQ